MNEVVGDTLQELSIPEDEDIVDLESLFQSHYRSGDYKKERETYLQMPQTLKDDPV
jgi:hypothetical protein